MVVKPWPCISRIIQGRLQLNQLCEQHQQLVPFLFVEQFQYHSLRKPPI